MARARRKGPEVESSWNVNINGEDTDLVGLAEFASRLLVHCYECGRKVSKYDSGYSMGRHENCDDPTPR